MNTVNYSLILAFVPWLWAVSGYADDGVERAWLSKTDGTFVGPAGRLTLAYEGEGDVAVTLQTGRCRVTPSTATAATVGEQVVLLRSDSGTTSLVIFFEENYIVLAALEAFSPAFCEAGQDVDGKYLLIQPE